MPAPAPILTWPGKRDPAPVAALAHHVTETFEPDGRLPLPTDAAGWNRLFAGDNLPWLHALAAGDGRGRFKLIYVDPPYGSGVAWARKVRLRGAPRVVGRRVLTRQPEYDDDLDEAGYLQFMLDRLHVLRDLIAEDGTLWLHCDHRHTHHLRALLDEVFGAEQWLNTITWRSQTARGAKSSALYFAHSAHSIHVVCSNRKAGLTWNPPKRRYIFSEAEASAEFMRDEGGFFRTSDPGSYSFESLKRLHAEKRLYAPYGGAIVVDEEHRRVTCSHGGNIGVKYYLTDLGQGRHMVERSVDNIWEDVPGLGTTPGEDTGYPTQKTQALLERIVGAATLPGDWVLDPFCGSGTALVTAQRLGRRWVGGDASPRALQTATHRLYAAIGEQRPHPPEGEWRHFALLRPQKRAETEAGSAAAPESDATAAVLITRNAVDADRIRIDLTGYSSSELAALLGSQHVDGRALIDAVAIDADYDGRTLRVSRADAPTRRNRQVAGHYEVTTPHRAGTGVEGAAATVALRVTDILGRQTTLTVPVARPCTEAEPAGAEPAGAEPAGAEPAGAEPAGAMAEHTTDR